MSLIPNEQLTLAHLPGPDARWEEIERFALTFDGYARIGPRLGELAKKHFDDGTLPDSLDELRGCLFLHQRSWRHVGGRPDERAMAHFRALIFGMRGKLLSSRP
jgi:hypothetical protein